MNKPNKHNKSKAKSGSAAVETAIVLPLFIMLAFGLFEYGWHFHNSHILNNAARQGARTATVHGNSNEEVAAAVLDSLRDSIGIDPADVNVRLAKMDTNSSKEDYTIDTLDEEENGSHVRVIITVQNRNLRGPIGMFLSRDEQRSVSATMYRNP